MTTRANRSADTITADSWDLYWRQVERTLDHVFGGDRNTLARLRSRVQMSDAALQASVYHLDPFQVAADLAGVDEVTFEQKSRYGDVLREFSSEGLSFDLDQLSVGNESTRPGGYKLGLIEGVLPEQLRLALPDDVAGGRS